MAVELLIATRIPLFSEGLRTLFQKEASISAELLPIHEEIADRLSKAPPDILLTDRETGWSLIEKTTLPPNVRLIILQEASYDPAKSGSLQRLVPKGLAGVLDRRADIPQLLRAVQSVAAGELWFDHRAVRATLCGSTRQPDVRLTGREAEVLRLLCEGCSNKEIAHRLYVSEQTVKTHCNHLYKKFGVNGRLKLALCAAQHTAAALHEISEARLH